MVRVDREVGAYAHAEAEAQPLKETHLAYESFAFCCTAMSRSTSVLGRCCGIELWAKQGRGVRGRRDVRVWAACGLRGV